MRANLASWIAAMFAVAVLVRFQAEPWTPMRIAGAVTGGVGLVLLSVARYQLGRAFSVRAKATVLVTNGVYAYLRNPIYVAGEVIFVGAALFLHSCWPLLVVAVTVPIQVARARREAAVLEAAFGEAYRAYRTRSWF